MRAAFRVLVLWSLPLAACGGSSHGSTTPSRSSADRLRFNQLAMRLNEPLFWSRYLLQS